LCDVSIARTLDVLERLQVLHNLDVFVVLRGDSASIGSLDHFLFGLFFLALLLLDPLLLEALFL